ncbi:MAG: glycine cleavage system aminomethyltransferase GcvT [bacterium]
MDNSTTTSPLFSEYPGEPSFMEFAGWRMPRDFSGIIAEHNSVRDSAGVFDLSHMGRFIVRGPECDRKLGELFTRDLARAENNKALYGFFCNSNGSCLDDVIVYRRGSDECWLVVNAANRQKIYDWLDKKLEGLSLADVTADTVLLALQGPEAPEIWDKLDLNLPEGLFRATWTGKGMRATTGYTGEAGGELWLDIGEGREVYRRLCEEVQPCGLGARDSLRLEKGYPLYGHDLGGDIDPLRANLQNFIDWEHEFTGREELKKYRESSPERVIKGFEMEGRRSPGDSSPVFYRGEEAGRITSASYCPTLGRAGGLALVDREIKPGEEIEVEISGSHKPATVSKMPLV